MIKKLWIFSFLFFSTTFIYGQNFKKHIDYSKFYGIDFNDHIYTFGLSFSNSLAQMKAEEWLKLRLNIDIYKRRKCEAELASTGLTFKQIRKEEKLLIECKKNINTDDNFFNLFDSKVLLFATGAIDPTGPFNKETSKIFPLMLTLSKGFDSEIDFTINSESALDRIIVFLKRTYGDPDELTSKPGVFQMYKWNFSNHTLICRILKKDKTIYVDYAVGNF